MFGSRSCTDFPRQSQILLLLISATATPFGPEVKNCRLQESSRLLEPKLRPFWFPSLNLGFALAATGGKCGG